MIRHSSEADDRSPGDFHSTGASYVPRKDSRGTKPARGTPYLWLERGISRAAKHYEINTITMQRSNEMRTAYLKAILQGSRRLANCALRH